ncbi:hypothetical protein TNCV_4262671 [Trichonephila clavipes]|nr:hypothetical protein TNCV_4262671 [Trichonephila clavipes]
MMTPESRHFSPNFHVTPTGRHLTHDIFNVHRLPLHDGTSVVLGLNSRLVSSHAKPVEVCSQKIMAGGYAKAGNRFGSLHLSRDWTHTGQSFPWLSKSLGVLGHDIIFVNVCGNNAFCSSECQGGFQFRRLGSLLGSLIAREPNRTWDSLGGAIKIVIEKGGASIESLRSTAVIHEKYVVRLKNSRTAAVAEDETKYYYTFNYLKCTPPGLVGLVHILGPTHTAVIIRSWLALLRDTWNWRGGKYSPAPALVVSAATTHKTFGPTDLMNTYTMCTRREFGSIAHRTQSFRSGELVNVGYSGTRAKSGYTAQAIRQNIKNIS